MRCGGDYGVLLCVGGADLVGGRVVADISRLLHFEFYVSVFLSVTLAFLNNFHTDNTYVIKVLIRLLFKVGWSGFV